MKKVQPAKKLRLNKLVVSQLVDQSKVMGKGNGLEAGLEDSTIKISNYITQCYGDSVCASYLDGCFQSKEC